MTDIVDMGRSSMRMFFCLRCQGGFMPFTIFTIVCNRFVIIDNITVAIDERIVHRLFTRDKKVRGLGHQMRGDQFK